MENRYFGTTMSTNNTKDTNDTRQTQLPKSSLRGWQNSSDSLSPKLKSYRLDLLPALKRCLLPIRSPRLKRTFQTLSTPICAREIEMRSDSGDDIGGGGC